MSDDPTITRTFDAAIGKVKAETALPVFLGAPEA